ncbi:MAG: septum formation initiator family protein [Clostridium sp.]|nr:septum formation initiator family protein [Clostridium sp.]
MQTRETKRKRVNSTKRLHSRLLISAAVVFILVLGIRMVSLNSSAAEERKEIAQKQVELSELQRQNERYEDELRQLKEGDDLRPLIERIAHELGLVYPGERVFRAAE